MKRIVALAAALVMTALVGAGMLAIGVNAMLDPKPAAASAASGGSTVSSGDPSAQAQIARLQSLITQYQNREQQYQAELSQANAQIQQYQALLMDLQRLGVIHINNDGSVQLGRRGFGGDN